MLVLDALDVTVRGNGWIAGGKLQEYDFKGFVRANSAMG
jgi:hypothetical protein